MHRFDYSSEGILHVLLQTGYHTESVFCLPLTIRGTVAGVLEFVNKLPGEDSEGFTEEDGGVIEQFGNFIGLALHHAKLYDKIRKTENKFQVCDG